MNTLVSVLRRIRWWMWLIIGIALAAACYFIWAPTKLAEGHVVFQPEVPGYYTIKVDMGYLLTTGIPKEFGDAHLVISKDDHVIAVADGHGYNWDQLEFNHVPLSGIPHDFKMELVAFQAGSHEYARTGGFLHLNAPQGP